jgi:superfamily II DNA or RNA helicase/HKD family nuclease
MPQPCPLCVPDPRDLLALDGAFWMLRDGGAIVLTPRAHIATWRALDAGARAALAEAICAAQDRIGGAPAVAFDETGPHLRIRIGAAPAIPAKPADHATLIAGPDDALLRHLRPHIDAARSVDAAIAFAMRSGVDLLFAHLEELLERDGKLRLLVGDYMGASDPEALRRLLDLPPGAELMAFEAQGTAFHPKSRLIAESGGAGALIVGSSNLSRSALETGVEWNLRLLRSPDEMDAARLAFDAVFARPEVRPLTHAWIDAYDARRHPDPPALTGATLTEAALTEAAPEPVPDAPEPHGVQADALAALARTRAIGHRAGLAVLATGLGKTYLAAFDSRGYPRVLFLAHREEILSQAMRAFRAVRPGAKLGRWDGTEKTEGAQILFASVQTLSRARGLDAFAPDAFDYVVVDEFHHAAAATYRRVMTHFRPRFLLGLTATPERTDGGDLLALCGENLVYRCDMWAGIEAGLLAPFTYHGLPDSVDYAQIPWRGRRFDEEALTDAVATHARAGAALDDLAAKGGARTIGFCVSQRHARFMADAARARGLRAAAVYAGAGSDPRASALEALEGGELDILFAVDMFNEGLDVPAIDTVLMLRPTQSPVIWLQQFGRGLRLSPSKDRLTVIDYVGAHRSFLMAARALLQAAETDRALEERLRDLRSGALTPPAGCEILYETESLDILTLLLRRTGAGDQDQLAAWHADFRARHDQRPTASEAFHAGFDPRKTGHGGWIPHLAAMGDLTAQETAALNGFGGLLALLETTAAGGAQMPALLGMIEAGAFPGEIALPTLAARMATLATGAPVPRAVLGADLGADLAVDPGDRRDVARLLHDRALTAWADAEDGRWFTLDDMTFATRIAPPAAIGAALAGMVRELAEWRLAEHLGAADRAFPTPAIAADEAAEGAATFARAAPWLEYMREDIPPLFGETFSIGNWNTGLVTLARRKTLVLLATLGKGGMSAGAHYDDLFEDPGVFRWSSQTSTTRGGKRGKILSGATPGWTTELFVRPERLRNGRACPFRRAGPVTFLGWEGDAPISVRWRLAAPVPEALRHVFRVPGA